MRVVGCSGQYWMLLCFFRFWLMLGTASLWVGSELVVFDVVFLIFGLPSVVPARVGFQDLVFGDMTSMLSFITRTRLYVLLISFYLPFPLCSLISFLKFGLWFLGGWISFSLPPIVSFSPLSFVSILKVWSFLSRALWFFAGMYALFVLVCVFKLRGDFGLPVLSYDF
ncbi:hypothetical protein HID58_001802 [Brassica napus]|uniref:Transmembrane protein n=1 Tax=Brassica napus TaxID=3708 RepID=A0ABQ8EKP5_BRANA|nr:hypothetical protein HID58_001802 [Brassica napus]